MSLSSASQEHSSCTVSLGDPEKELARGAFSSLLLLPQQGCFLLCMACCCSLQLQEKHQSTASALAWWKPWDVLRKPKAKGLRRCRRRDQGGYKELVKSFICLEGGDKTTKNRPDCQHPLNTGPNLHHQGKSLWGILQKEEQNQTPPATAHGRHNPSNFYSRQGLQGTHCTKFA